MTQNDTPAEGTFHGEQILGIKKCARCGDTGEPGEEYSVRGVARMGGNLCIDCAEERFEAEGVDRFEY